MVRGGMTELGDRVACAVEDESGDFSDWAAGEVVEADRPRILLLEGTRACYIPLFFQPCSLHSRRVCPRGAHA